MRFYLGGLPVVGVGYLSASFALPDGFALRRQCLEVIGQLEPIVLAGRTQNTRDDFLWLSIVFQLVGSRGFVRFFNVKLQTARHRERILVYCHWPASHKVPSLLGILVLVKQGQFIGTIIIGRVK